MWIGAALIAALLRSRTSAAHRHLVWLLAQSSAVLIPLIFLMLPPRRIEAPPQKTAVIEAPLTQTAISAPSPRRHLPPALPLTWIWLVGVGVVLAWTALGVLRVRWLSRRAVVFPVRDKGVPVLLSERAGAPFTWGSLRPEIVLPAAAEHWEPDQLRSALLHELAHVRRRDWTVLMTSRAVCAIYWFHPLAWLANRELRRLSEHVCDDFVLHQGVNPMKYTQQLVELARLARPATLSASVAMAGSSALEARVKAILNPRTHRGSVRLAEGCLAAGLVLLLLIAAFPVHGVAQSSGAILAGVAHDPTGAAVPGVSVTVSNDARQEIATTSDSGGYQFVGLLPGSYQLEARKPGFTIFKLA
ncbi:MAG: M56 family metallopeptidase, partial [Bryobacteraceae bacterium]